MDRREETKKLAEQLFAEAEGNAHRLAVTAAQYRMALSPRGGALEVVGIVSSSTGRPVVQMRWGDEVGQVEVEAARAHAMLVLESAQNAVTDAAIYEWARKDLKLDHDAAGTFIDALRTYRADRWGQPDIDLEFQTPPPEDAT